MSNLKIEGIIVRIGESQNVSKDATKPFNKRSLIVEIPDGNYPQTIQFEAVQDRCDLLDAYTEGQSVTVHFNLRGREWEGKVFNTLNIWKIEAAQGTQSAAPSAQQAPPANVPQNGGNTAIGEISGDETPPDDQELPF